MLAGCATVPQGASDGLLIRDVAVIPMDRDGSLAHQDVLVANGRIAAMGPTGSLAARRAQVIDGAGKYLMPGLWDMHVHALGTEGSPADTLRRYLPWGITGVRDMGSSVEQLRLARSEVAGRDDLPELVASGPLLDGPRHAWTQRVARPLVDPAQATAAVEELHAAGVDFLKVYSGLSPAQHEAIVTSARARNLSFAGHVPFSMSVEQASAAGQRGIDHAGLQLAKDCIPDGNKAIPAMLNAWIRHGYPGRAEESRRWFARQDIAACRALYRRMAARGTWVTPTIGVEVKGGSWTSTAVLDHMPGRNRDACRETLTSIDSAPAARDAAARDLFEQVRELHAAGVPLLAGSDVPNECLWHGISLHDELRLLREAGLSPWEVLRTATLNPARFLGRSDEGVVRAGAKANLLLLDANPLEEVGNTRRIAGVMVSGRWHDAAALARLSDAPTTIYKNASVWNGAGFEQRDLAVRNGRFIALADAEAGAAARDAAGGFIVPAYGNAHAHLTSPTMRSSWSFMEQGVFYVWNPNTIVLGPEARSFFARPDTFDVRIAQGGITEPGGHPEKLYVDVLSRFVYQGRPFEWFLGNAFHYGRTPAEIDSALDRLVEQRADFVKIYLLHSEEYQRRREDPAYRGSKGLNPANIGHLVAAARRRSLFAAAHVETVADLRTAARNGVAVALHLPAYWRVATAGELAVRTLSAADAAMIARSGMSVVPTYALALSDDNAATRGTGAPVSREQVLAVQARNIRLLKEAGIPLLIGTDTAGAIFEEVEHLVNIGALTRLEAVQAALTTGRRLFPQRRIGCFEPGCEADFLVLGGDPTQDVRALRELRLRIKAGRTMEAPPVPS
jgi:imidazolonepropionase-like amidohydrolase